MTDTTTDYARGFRAGIEAAAEYVDSDYPVLADHIRQLTPAAPEPSEEAVRRVAIAISGAPFPSKRSMEKARAALKAMEGEW